VVVNDSTSRSRGMEATAIAEASAQTARAVEPAIPAVPCEALDERLGFAVPFRPAPESLSKSLVDWKMDADDMPILRYLYRHFRPRRHLEFGTWEGAGVVACLEECDATVWTLNLPDGECWPDGKYAYPRKVEPGAVVPAGVTSRPADDDIVVQSDAGWFVGRLYREKGLGHRVCQVYCDSRDWDTSSYPDGFFDSVLVDGGHTEEIVASDTRKAMRLVRPGGLVLWHDFCPDPDVHARCASPRGVHRAISTSWPWLEHELQDAFWIKPSWLLVGIKRSGPDKRVGSARDLDASEGGS